VKNTEAVVRVIASGTEDAEQFVALLSALGFAVIPKSDADQLERTRRKTGGTHPVAPGRWQVNASDAWVSVCVGGWETGPGMFSPAEAREVAMALIVFAAQAERHRL
jgi:hypothetical protein